MAKVLRAKWDPGLRGGVLIAHLIPEDAEIPAQEIDPKISASLADMSSRGIGGKDATPFLLGRIVELTGGRSLAANIALVRNNARLASDIAVAHVQPLDLNIGRRRASPVNAAGLITPARVASTDRGALRSRTQADKFSDMQRLVNAWVWTTTALVVLIGFFYVSLVWLVTAPFDPGRYASGRAFRHLAVLCTWLNPYWHFNTSGIAVHDPRRPYVVVANHESYADIFLVSHLKWEMKWLAKDTIFRIPVMGWMMRMAGDIPINRGSRGSALLALEACRDRLSKRVSVMVFPEGTRSRTDDLLPFKDGAFQLAISMGAPILPIAIAGTRNAMAKGSFSFRRANAICRVLAPIETAGLSSADLPALRDRTRELIDDARRELQGELRK